MIFSLISGFIIGIWVGSFVQMTLTRFIFCLFLLVIIFIYKYFVSRDPSSTSGQEKVPLILVFILLGFILGFSRIYFSNLYAHSKLDSFAGERISAQGIVVDEPDVREHNTKLTVRISDVNFSDQSIKVSEKILITLPIYPEFFYGDKVQMDLILVKPKLIDSDGRTFDYSGYLRVRGIWYISRFAQVSLIESGHGSVIKNLLFKIKNNFMQALNRALPAPESSLMAGLLLGAKQSLGKELLSEFQRAGVSHVVVLSGYNIAIVAQSIMSFLSFLPASVSFGFGCLGIVLFTILSGGGASAWRAAIMVLVALFAKKMNRDYKSGRVLGFVIILMLAPNPLLLAFDPSFQLSVLATVGIIFVSPFLTPYLTRVTEKYSLREIVSSTLATQIIVLPYLIYNTGILSLVSLPVNILILGTVPLTMLLGFIVGIIGLFSLYLSFIPALFAYIFLWYQLSVVHIGATLPFGVLILPTFSIWFVILIYLSIGYGLYVLQKRK